MKTNYNLCNKHGKNVLNSDVCLYQSVWNMKLCTIDKKPCKAFKIAKK